MSETTRKSARKVDAALQARIDRQAATLTADTTLAFKRLRSSTAAAFYRFRLAHDLAGLREVR